MPVTRSQSQTVLKRSDTDLPLSDKDDSLPAHLATTFLSTTVGFKICFFVLALPCYLVGPGSICLALYHLYHYRQFTCLPHQSVFYAFFLYHGYLEIPFSPFYQYMAYKAQEPKPHPPLDTDHLHNLILQCLSVGVPVDHGGAVRRPKQMEEPDWLSAPEESIPIVRNKLRAWFHHAPTSEIKRENVREWLAWAVAGGVTLEQANADPKLSELVDKATDIVQSRLRYTFEEGYNPKVETIRLTLNRVRIRMRPVGYYVVCNGLTFGTYLYLIIIGGFRIRHSHGSQLLVKPASKSKDSSKSDVLHARLPVVFLHGLGIGLAQYFAFLKHLAKTDAGAVILLQPNISVMIWHPRYLNPPSKEDYVAAVQETCASLGFNKATILSHSNGTMVHGWMLRGCRELCQRNILVDPVCFRLWEGDVCYTFLYQKWRTAMNCLLGYFVAREIGVAHSISRDFVWHDMTMFEHELPDTDPDRLRIIIGTEDSLVDYASVVDYLHECGVPDASVKVIEGYNHGQSLIMNGKGMDEVLKAL